MKQKYMFIINVEVKIGLKYVFYLCFVMHEEKTTRIISIKNRMENYDLLFH